MRSKEVPRKVSCVTSDLQLECSIVQRRIQDVTLQACGFTQATPTAKELNLQVALTLIRHTSQSLMTSSDLQKCLFDIAAGAPQRHCRRDGGRHRLLGHRWYSHRSPSCGTSQAWKTPRSLQCDHNSQSCISARQL